MTQSQPLALADRLQSEVDDFVHDTCNLAAVNQLRFRRLMAECETLSKTEPLLASALKATLCSAVGDEVEFERWVRNIEHHKDKDLARLIRMVHYCHHCYASKSLELAAAVFANPKGRSLMELAEAIAGSGGLAMAKATIDASVEKHLVLAKNRGIEFLRAAADALAALAISDQEVAAMMDVAGEILRRESLTWMDRRPSVIANHFGNRPSFVMEIRIETSPEEAARLTWELTDLLIERGVDREGVYFGFLGSVIPQLETV